MNQRAILYLILGFVGVPILIQIGAWSATDPVYAGIAGIVVIGAVVLTQLGAKCWLLIPFFAAFAGSMSVLPGNFAPRDLAVGLVALILPPLWVLQRFPIRVQIGSLEIVLLGLLLLLGQAFLRNPAGLRIFGTEVVGGRPYFEVVVSAVAWVILSILVVDLKSIRTMVFAKFGGSMISAIYETAVGLFPALSIYAATVYRSETTSVALKEYFSNPDPRQGMGRLFFIGKFSLPIMNLVLAFKSPLQLGIPRNFGYLLLAAFAGVAILLSGFRGGVAANGMLVIAAAFVHRKPIQLFVMLLIGGPLLAVVLVLQGSVMELPLAAQRALSFLPADWDRRAVRDAEGSSEWRFEMWEDALTSDRYIRNKWLGDGFGFTAQEMSYQQELMIRGIRPEDMQDYFLTIGTYHSGPIETIKRIGYFGLGALLISMVVFFRECLALIKRARGTPYFPYALFVTLPILIHPFTFIIIYGSFQGSLTTLLIGGGMMRLLKNSLEQWKQKLATEGAVASGKLADS